MATAQQIEMLVRAHYSRNDEMFRKAVLQMACTAENNKHVRHAKVLRSLSGHGMVELVPANAKNLLRPVVDTKRLDEMVLSDVVLDKIKSLSLEHEKSNLLLEEGLAPTNKIILNGPPGTGKTSLALAIAEMLGRSMYSVQTHSIVDSHLGKTGSNISVVFEAIRTMPDGVFFIDEFDSLASKRFTSDSAGATENNRTVNILLQMLDLMSDGVLIVATNMYKDLDPAIIRRFELFIEMQEPNPDERENLIRMFTAGFNLSDESIRTVVSETEGLNQANIRVGCLSAKKAAILCGHRNIDASTITRVARGSIQ